LRELTLNGYIDDEVWCGDEITPEILHESLYGANNTYADDVHIRLNSYGGSCNAAVRMFDDIREYPGSVSITLSGTAASAATVLCMAADRLEITPGSLFMLHDPSMMAFGNERDLSDSIALLRACKSSILNMYEQRVRMSRNDVSAMMTATTWMDAKTAVEYGFVDAVSEETTKLPTNSGEARTLDAQLAKERVNAWLERKRHPQRAVVVAEATPEAKPIAEPNPEAVDAADTSTELTIVVVPTVEPVETQQADPIIPTRVRVTRIDNRLNDLRY